MANHSSSADLAGPPRRASGGTGAAFSPSAACGVVSVPGASRLALPVRSLVALLVVTLAAGCHLLAPYEEDRRRAEDVLPLLTVAAARIDSGLPLPDAPGPDAELAQPDAALAPDVGVVGPCGTNPEARVVELTNARRVARGLQPLACDRAIRDVASTYAQRMCIENFFDTIAPDGTAVWDRLAAAGVSFMMAAENIARGQTTPLEVVTTWMQSNERSSILAPAYTHIGVGHADCPGRGHYWVQDFVRR